MQNYNNDSLGKDRAHFTNLSSIRLARLVDRCLISRSPGESCLIIRNFELFCYYPESKRNKLQNLAFSTQSFSSGPANMPHVGTDYSISFLAIALRQGTMHGSQCCINI